MFFLKKWLSDDIMSIYTKRGFVFNHMPKIIIKVDDLCGMTPKMKRFVAWCSKKNIPLCLGLIGISLENPSKNYLAWLKDLLSKGKIELFNHGYLHCRPLEFQGPSLKLQKQSILMTQNIAKEKLGVTIRTIGTPENASDINTLKALENVDDIDTWFFGQENYSKTLYKREVYLEKPFPMPSLNHVIDGIKTKNNLNVVVLECHPQSWTNDELKIFYKIINFLKLNKAEFILPHMQDKNDIVI